MGRDGPRRRQRREVARDFSDTCQSKSFRVVRRGKRVFPLPRRRDVTPVYGEKGINLKDTLFRPGELSSRSVRNPPVPYLSPLPVTRRRLRDEGGDVPSFERSPT